MRCKKCSLNCATCLKEKKYLIHEPYPITITPDEKIVPHSYDRWFWDYQAIVRAYIRQHFNTGDWTAQYEWMAKRPQVAYNMINDYELPNEVKIAKALKILIYCEYGVTLIPGMQGGGKTWTWLWLAEVMHEMNPKKMIYYYGRGLRVPEWVKLIDDISKIQNDSWLCVDEGGIRASARRSMSNMNKWLSDLAAICRHKKLHLFFLSQRPELLDKNLRRLALAYLLKPVRIHESDRRDVYYEIAPYIPEKVEITGFVDMKTKNGRAFTFFQPAPRSPERSDFTEAFKNFDVSVGEALFGPKQRLGPKEKREVVACSVCGYSWRPRGEAPARCPKCDSRQWDKDKQGSLHTHNYVTIEQQNGGKPYVKG